MSDFGGYDVKMRVSHGKSKQGKMCGQFPDDQGRPETLFSGSVVSFRTVRCGFSELTNSDKTLDNTAVRLRTGRGLFWFG